MFLPLQICKSNNVVVAALVHVDDISRIEQATDGTARVVLRSEMEATLVLESFDQLYGALAAAAVNRIIYLS